MFRNPIIKYLVPCLLFLLCTGISYCGKKGGGNPAPPPAPAEENLVISIDPDPGATTAAALGANYDFKVVIQSKMPTAGVKVDVACTRDADNVSISSRSLTGSAATVNTFVDNLQPGQLYTVKVTVTSVSKPSNAASKTFKLARK
jgi:hypothetical protein